MNLVTLTTLYKTIFDALSRALDGTCYVISGCAPSANGTGLRVDITAGSSVEGSILHSGFAGGNVTMAAAPSTLSLQYRRDIVYRDPAGLLTFATGTPDLLTSTTPLPPALPAQSTVLAIVFIAPGQTVLASTDVEDVRQTRGVMTWLERFTKAGLPTPGTTGRLVALTDTDRGMWLDNGTQFWPTGGQVYNLLAFNADPTGVADSTTAIQAWVTACAGGRGYAPPGTYKYTAAWTTASVGTELYGAGMGKTIFKAGGAVNGLVVGNAGFNKIADMEFDGNSVGLNGVMLYDAGRTVVSRVSSHNFTQDGMRLNLFYTTPTGNNNFARFEFCRSYNNTLRGFAVQGDPATSLDNNGIVWFDCEAQGNGASGLLYKGVGARILFGQYSANTRYGVELGEAADTAFTVDGVVFYPWLEGNTLGGVGLTKTTRWRIFTATPIPPVGSFTVIPIGASQAIHEFVDTGGSNTTAMLVTQGETVGGPLGAVSIGGSGAGIAVWEQIVTATAAWTPGNLAAGAQAVSAAVVMPAGTFARLGDAVHASADVDLQGQQLTAYVNTGDRVTAVLRNGTAGAINLGTFNLRVEVFKH
jgi:hypothetical protein